MSGRREDEGAPAAGPASHAVLVVEYSRSPFARCHHGLSRHRPPRRFSPQIVPTWPDLFKPQVKTPPSLSKRASLHGRRHHDQFADSSQGENIVLSLFLSCVRSNFVQNLCGA